MDVGLVASKSWWPPNRRTAVVLSVGRCWLPPGCREILEVWGMGPKGGCTVSILGDFQEEAEYSPEQPVLSSWLTLL